MTKLQEQQLDNGKVCNMFYSTPDIKNMIGARQMDIVGEMIRGAPDRPSHNMITACCDHIYPKIYTSFFKTSQLSRGSQCSRIYKVSHKKYWCQLVDRLLHPATPVPDRPADWGPPTGDASDSNDETTTDDDEEQPRIPPRSQAPQQSNSTEIPYDPKQWLKDSALCSMVG